MESNNAIVSRTEIKRAPMAMAVVCNRMKRMEEAVVQGEWIKP